MKIYVVYERICTDWNNGEDGEVFMEYAYKNKRKAIKQANKLLNESKEYDLRVEGRLRKKKNPFKNNNCVDLYNDEQEDRIKCIMIEEIKLVA